MQDSGLDLSHLDRLLGDVLLEGEIARTPRAAVYRVRTGGGDGRPLALKVALQPGATPKTSRASATRCACSRRPATRTSSRSTTSASCPGTSRSSPWSCWRPDGSPSGSAGAAGSLLRRGPPGRGRPRPHPPPGRGPHGHQARPTWGSDVRSCRLSRSSTSASPSESRGPLDRRIRGTLAYTAPEVLLQDSYDHRADLYSLGMTLFELATGVLPSAGRGRHGGDPLPPGGGAARPPRAAARHAAGARRASSRGCSSANPADRYASAGRLLADLGGGRGRPGRRPRRSSFSEGTVLASRLVGRDEVLGRLRSRSGRGGGGTGRGAADRGRGGGGQEPAAARVPAARRDRGGAGRAAAREAGRARAAPRAVPRGPERLGDRGAGPARRTPAGESVPRERYRLYQEIAPALSAGARTGPPMVLLLDDLHLAGPESEELLAYLGRGAARRAGAGGGGPASGRGRRAPGEADGTRCRTSSCLRRSTAPRPPSWSTPRLGTAGLPASFYAWVHERTRGCRARSSSSCGSLVDDRCCSTATASGSRPLPALARWASPPGRPRRPRLAAARGAARPPSARCWRPRRSIAEPFSLGPARRAPGRGSAGGLRAALRPGRAGYLERLREAGGVRLPLRPAAGSARRSTPAWTPSGGPRSTAAWPSCWKSGCGRASPGLAAAVAEHFWRGGERARSLPYLLRAAEEATRRLRLRPGRRRSTAAPPRPPPKRATRRPMARGPRRARPRRWRRRAPSRAPCGSTRTC